MCNWLEECVLRAYDPWASADGVMHVAFKGHCYFHLLMAFRDGRSRVAAERWAVQGTDATDLHQRGQERSSGDFKKKNTQGKALLGRLGKRLLQFLGRRKGKSQRNERKGRKKCKWK